MKQKNIIIKIQGGLGNQLFQYAYVRSLSEKYKMPFKMDLTSYNGKDDKNPDKIFNRGFGIDKFNTLKNIASKKEIKYFKKFQRKNGKIWYLYNKLIANDSIYIQERQFNFNYEYYNPKVLENNQSIYLDGYWQTERYFKDFEKIIRKELTFKENPNRKNQKFIEKITNCQSVCLHIRRGNFLIKKYNNFHGICSIDYYKEAIKIICQKVDNPTFFVFSDDPKWAEKNIKTKFSVEFINWNKPENDYDDLRLMSNCKHFIIANSSFSWWGAWLSRNTNKIVIAPSQIVKKQCNTTDYTPKKWIRLNTKLI